jgi:hypothetical protein
MKKQEIEFEYDFERDVMFPIPLGRLVIGNYLARLVFSPEGKTILFISEKAVKDGSIVLLKDQPQILGLKPKEQE